MLDENLPTFFLKPSPDRLKHNHAFYFSRYGSEPEAAYALHRLDPATPAARNCYAAALFDSHNPEILFGEVLMKPEWTQPTLSQEEIRKNGGVPPPPQPIIPTEFTIQLYNPDQQVVVTQKTGFWSGSSTYEFSMPQTSFRTPSASSLDRSMNDPLVDAATPRMNFIWKREGRMSKDMTCFLTGKSNDKATKKKHKEPDIAVALFSSLREVTIYEPNMNRVEMEDYKGLEVVLLLGAAVIRDVFFGNTKETFHITEPQRKNSGPFLGRKPSPQQNASSSARPAPAVMPPPQHPSQPVMNGTPTSRPPQKRQSYPPVQPAAAQGVQRDPLSQWQIDAETARLKAASAAEQQNMQRLEESRRRERQRTEEAEAKRIKKMLDVEEKERKRRQAEVDKETERLRRIYGTQQQTLAAPPQAAPHRHSAPLLQGPFPQQPSRAPQPRPVQQRPVQQPSRPQPSRTQFVGGPYLQVNGARPVAAQSTFFGASSGLAPPDDGRKLKTGKKSLWGLRNKSESDGAKLMKKKSSMF